jgi:tetratricopeptide (TPR) repeat protein
VFDDLHWGEETFLDLVEHVADLARDAAILLLCMARPELLDRRTGWGGGKVNATTVLLEPLAPKETDILIASLAQLDEGICARIREASEGNPLFVEEIVALLQESDDGEVTIPSTIQVLLAARLDQLDPAERDVLQRGAVEGRIFHRGAVRALSAEGNQLTAHLTALVRKELIRPDQAQLLGEDAFRFRHLLIREAAYDALPKGIRAELHERFADWLAEHGADLVELDEVLGYHLEQSHRFRQELGQSGELLASRAAARLSAAGRRALDRGDMEGASNLLVRAAALLDEGNRERLELEVELGEALLESGRLSEAASLLEQTLVRARQIGDELLQARAQVGLASVHVQTQRQSEHEDIERDVEPLVAVLESAEDHRGAADALRLLGLLKRWSGDYETAADLQERALVHARQVGDEWREAAIIRHIGSIALWSPEHVDPALARCRAILGGASNGRVRANCLIRIGGLEGLAARFDAAWDAIDRARAIMDDLGLRHLKAHSSDVAVLVAMLAGDFERAEREAREAYAVLAEMGDLTFQGAQANLLGEALAAQGGSTKPPSGSRSGKKSATTRRASTWRCCSPPGEGSWTEQRNSLAPLSLWAVTCPSRSPSIRASCSPRFSSERGAQPRPGPRQKDA